MVRRSVLLIGLWLGLVASAQATTFTSDSFNYTDGLITNGWAYNHTGGYESPIWEVSSGSLFASNGWGWTGVPDACATDIDSNPCTYSSVFRAYTDWSGAPVTSIVNVTVKPYKWTNFNQTTADHGIKVWNRFQDQGHQLYVALVDGQDGRTYLKKKCAGGTVNGGTYYTLADDTTASEWIMDTVHTARFVVTKLTNGNEYLKLFRDGVLEMTAMDNGIGCVPLSFGGAGMRSDDAEFYFDNFVVSNS